MDHLKLVNDLVRDENLVLHPYKDNAVPPRLTIGVGRNLTDRGITKEEAFHLLANDIEEVVVQLDQNLPWWRKMDETRQRALANMCFNLGIHELLKFHNTLLLLQLGKYAEAAAHILDLPWAHQVGARADRIALDLRLGDSNA